MAFESWLHYQTRPEAAHSPVPEESGNLGVSLVHRGVEHCWSEMWIERAHSFDRADQLWEYQESKILMTAYVVDLPLQPLNCPLVTAR